MITFMKYSDDSDDGQLMSLHRASQSLAVTGCGRTKARSTSFEKKGIQYGTDKAKMKTRKMDMIKRKKMKRD